MEIMGIILIYHSLCKNRLFQITTENCLVCLTEIIGFVKSRKNKCLNNQHPK